MDTEAISHDIQVVVCMICGARGLWKPMPYEIGKIPTYRCRKCGNSLHDCRWENDKK